MKIKSVNIKDFKVIKNLEKEINGANIILLGDNGVGKSTFIQFIEIALGSQKNIPEELTSGEGMVVVDKSGNEYTFHVKFKKGKPVVTVVAPDGFKDDRKSTIANLVGAMDFDIDEFVKLSETTAGQKKQVEIFKSFLPKDVREYIDNMEYRVKKHFDERTEKGRDLKSLEGALAEHKWHKMPMTELPSNPISTKEIDEKIESSLISNKKVEEVRFRFEERKKTISDIQAQIADLQEKLKLAEQSQNNASEWLKTNHVIDTTALMAEKDKAYEINAAIEVKGDYLKKRAEVEALKEEYGELTALIESSRQVISDAIKDFDSPVEGLTFTDDNLLYRNVPVAAGNLSTSEIMELGILMKMAENPELGILFIQRGESLGKARLEFIQQLAKKHDWQIIMEQVQRGKEQLTIEIMEG